MKLIIVDQFGKNKIIDNPVIIPRIGDQVSWFYAPAPKVSVVNIDYDKEEIVAVVG